MNGRTLSELDAQVGDIVVHVLTGTEYEIEFIRDGKYFPISDEPEPSTALLGEVCMWKIKKRFIDPVEFVTWIKVNYVHLANAANVDLWLAGNKGVVPPIWRSYYETPYREMLARDVNPEYQEYLRLKEKFDG